MSILYHGADVFKFLYNKTMNTKYILRIAIMILILLGGFYLLNNYIYKQKQGSGTETEPYRTTLTGVQTCLLHKDTSGPQTKECAIGMQTDTGEYYALDFMLISQIPPEIDTGERFTASGLITPIERLSTDHWQKYNVQGIFSITDFVEIQSSREVSIFNWKFEDSDSLNLDGLPNTDVFVEVVYEGGEVQTVLVDTQHGGCNELDSTDEDSVPNSKNAQCYAAGLGFTYKITEGEDSYLVKRKQFEEALPDYNPPTTEYEVINEINF